MSANVIFIDENLIKSRTGISDAIDGKQIFPQIKVAQDMYVQSALGSTLYLRLQAGVEAANLTVNEKTLINSFITDCLVWYTMSLLPFALGYQFFSKGVLQKEGEDSRAPSRADLELISNQYKQTAEFYKQRLINYLRENYQLYSQYINTGSGLDVIFPERRAYTCPIYLGNNKSDAVNRTYSGNNATSGVPVTIQLLAAIGVNTFNIPGLPTGATVIIATRSGQIKGITNAATASTLYLQINADVVTLPTGDITGAGEGGGELFTFTYR